MRIVCVSVFLLLITLCAHLVSATGVEATNWNLQGELGPDVPAFWIRPGYKVTLVARDIRNARFLEFDDKGTLFVSRPNQKDILAFRPAADGKYEKQNAFITDKQTAHGMQWKDGWLYFTQSDAIWKARDRDGDGKADEVIPIVGNDQLTGGGGHWFRPILVTTTSLYTEVGDAGNIDDGVPLGRETVFQFNLDGTGKRVFATGFRNTEKLLLRPGTEEIWGCDHGSDWFGKPLGDKEGRQPITDYNPPDEMNHITDGGFYGHPYIVGNRVPRIEFQNRRDILDLAEKTIVPEWNFNAHWAVNGFCFIRKNQFGADHLGDAFCALHGSWNRKQRSGYRVERVLFDKLTGHPYGSLCIVSTMAHDGKILARPVDCTEAPDGSVMFSCDQTGTIYRISAAGQK